MPRRAGPGVLRSGMAARTEPRARDDSQEARARAEELRLPFDPLDRLPDDDALWAEAPMELLVRYHCVPVGRAGRRLVLAFGGLEDLGRIDDAEHHLGRPIDAVLAPAGRVAEALRRHRGGEILLEQASESLRLQLVSE